MSQIWDSSTPHDRPDHSLTPDQLVAQGYIAHLRKSERGREALRNLADLLWKDCTWSLDADNIQGMTWLLGVSLQRPEVREMVQVYSRPR